MFIIDVGVGTSDSLANIFGGNGGTLSAWIKPRSWGNGTDFGRIVDKSTGTGAQNGWSWQLDNNDAGAAGPLAECQRLERRFDAGNNSWETYSSTLALDEWQHLVVTYNDSAAANDPLFYVDGVQVGAGHPTVSDSTALSDEASPLRIGNFMVDAGTNYRRPFDGLIDEVRIAKTIRSAVWIEFQYKSMQNDLLVFGDEEAR